MLNLKVLMWVRPDFHTFPGGDTQQVEYAAKALTELGWQVDVSSDADKNIDDYDIIHLWHLERCHETWLFFNRARENNKLIFLSPIYWPPNHKPLTRYCDKFRKGLIENIKCAIRLCINSGKGNRRFVLTVLKNGWLKCRHQLLNEVDLLIPNSKSEADIISDERTRQVPISVVPNVIDADKCDAIEKLSWNQRSMILCAGHFCPRKNQLALIKALKNTDVSVVFAGGFRPMHWRYYKRCLKAAGNQHTFLGSCSNEKVLELMGQSKVHIQTSAYETPGLVNLEAALMGCNLVLPPVKPIRDYFGELGNYYVSDDVDGIREAVFNAINTQPDESLETHIRTNYTIEQLKVHMEKAYQFGSRGD